MPLSGVNVGLEGVVRKSWGLPAVDYAVRRGVGSAGAGYGYGAGYGAGAAVDSGESSSSAVAEAEATSDVIEDGNRGGSGGLDSKGKGRARDVRTERSLRSLDKVRDMTEQEKEARLAQIQRQGGRMRERVVVYTKRDLAETKFEEVSSVRMSF